ncbi:MAG: hypothetical protein WDZ45_03310 [Flavobacteriaceae bacterium]
MDIESIIWFYLPIVIATIEVVWSLLLAFKKFSFFDSIVSFLILLLNGSSIYVLIIILMGSWPTYIPHIAIFIATILFVIQILRGKRKKVFGNISEEG